LQVVQLDPTDIRLRAWHQIRAALLKFLDPTRDCSSVAWRTIHNNCSGLEAVLRRRIWRSLG
jgi:hypothetical protein